MTAPNRLTDSRIQLHYAIQGIASAGMALGTPRPDGSQIAAVWSPELNCFVGQPLIGARVVYVALEPVALTSLILDEQYRAIATLPLTHQSLPAMMDWHRAELTRLGFRVPPLALLDYPADFPVHPVAFGAPFGGTVAGDRQALSAYYAQSRLLLQGVVAAQAQASPLHIWPHHFDMATLITVSGTGEWARTIGVGLSPGDRSYDQPYWYVTPWPAPPPDTLPRLSLGAWQIEGWVGAVLRATDLDHKPPGPMQPVVQTFLDEAIEVCHAVLDSVVYGS